MVAFRRKETPKTINGRILGSFSREASVMSSVSFSGINLFCIGEQIFDLIESLVMLLRLCKTSTFPGEVMQ